MLKDYWLNIDLVHNIHYIMFQGEKAPVTGRPVAIPATTDPLVKASDTCVCVCVCVCACACVRACVLCVCRKNKRKQ